MEKSQKKLNLKNLVYIRFSPHSGFGFTRFLYFSQQTIVQLSKNKDISLYL